jgi:hypothetical protein
LIWHATPECTQDPSITTSGVAVPTIPAVGATTTAAAATSAATKTATATATTAVFSIRNNEDGANDDWYLAPLGPRTLGKSADYGDDGHHVDHCGLQVLDLLLSDSESKDEIDASELDTCDEFEELWIVESSLILEFAYVEILRGSGFELCVAPMQTWTVWRRLRKGSEFFILLILMWLLKVSNKEHLGLNWHHYKH